MDTRHVAAISLVTQSHWHKQGGTKKISAGIGLSVVYSGAGLDPFQLRIFMVLEILTNTPALHRLPSLPSSLLSDPGSRWPFISCRRQHSPSLSTTAFYKGVKRADTADQLLVLIAKMKTFNMKSDLRG